MSEAERITREHAYKVVSWAWLEDFAKQRNLEIAKPFFDAAKEEWAKEMLKRMESGLFYGNESDKATAD